MRRRLWQPGSANSRQLPREIGWDFGWNLAPRGNLPGVLAEIWLTGEKLAGILAGIWLAGGKLAGILAGRQNSDFGRKSEFRLKPPRTTNFHPKDPGIDRLEFLTLVMMV